MVEAGIGVVTGVPVYLAGVAGFDDTATRTQHWEVAGAAVATAVGAFLTAKVGGSALRRSASAAAAPSAAADPTGDQPRRFSNLAGRNPHFTGREDTLQLLAEPPGPTRPRGQVLCGLGGVGKSQLALEYAHRHESEYDVVWWINAESRLAARTDLLALARRLGVREAKDQDDMLAAVLEELRRDRRWLLVFDNVEQYADIEPYWLPPGEVDCLATSRNPRWGAHAAVVELPVLDRDESVRFLSRRMPTAPAGAAAALADALGDLPLALEQAAAYLEETRLPAQDYLGLVEDRSPDLLRRGTPTGYQQTVATTWSISLATVAETMPAAAGLLGLFAYLAPDGIPRDLVPRHRQALPAPLADAAADPLTYADAIGLLVRFSLVAATETSLSLHRLVQVVVRDSHGAEGRRTHAAAATGLLAAAFPFHTREPATWPRCEELLPHALAVTRHAADLGAAPHQAGWLLDCAGSYLYERFQFRAARRVFERALGIDEAAYGPDDPAVAIDLHNLAVVALDLGALADSRALLERALRIVEAVYGPEHEAVAGVRIALGRTLQNLGDWPAARHQLERTLEVAEKLALPPDPVLAAVHNTLGGILQDLGDLPAAEAEFRRALGILTATRDPVDPAVAAIRGNLGRVLLEAGDLAAADRELELALTIDQQVYGDVHPSIATDLNNLGRLHHDMGELAEARRELEQALAMDEELIGADTHVVAIRCNNLAGVLHDQGQLPEARRLFERSLGIIEAIWGTGHRIVAVVRSNLGHVYEDGGDLRQAGTEYATAVEVSARVFGTDHPETQRQQQNLDRVLRLLGQSSRDGQGPG